VAPAACLLSFRLGGRDGVSVEAEKWGRVLAQLGFTVHTVAGEGPVDRVVPGLAIDASQPPSPAEIAAVVDDADVVVVENLCSLPMNVPAARVVAGVLRGRAAVLRHHDLAWQRDRYAHITELPPTDDAWRHVTINELSNRELASRGIDATTIPNGFDVDIAAGDRIATRAAIGVGADTLLVLQPTRAIARKNIPAAIAMAEDLGATYWIMGPAEEGYGPVLADLLASARVPTIHQGQVRAVDAYAACDAVLFPSSWEGFGNPTIESAIHRRPLAIGDYPVARELAAYGFRWFPADDARPLREFLTAPDDALLDHNAAVARRHFSLDAVARRLEALFAAAGWRW
jgi:mannosylglucosylglycerate synthase